MKTNPLLLIAAAVLSLAMLSGCTGGDTAPKDPNEKPAGQAGAPPPAGAGGASLANPVPPSGGK